LGGFSPLINSTRTKKIIFSSKETTTKKNLKIYRPYLGVDEANNKSLPLHEALKDDYRVDFYHRHLLALQSAIRSELIALCLIMEQSLM
jgi:hypothetical protein